MNTKTFKGIAIIAMLVFALSGCDSSSGIQADDDAGDSFALLTADLGLSDSDAAAIASEMDGFQAATAVDAPDPGFLWELAAQIHASLSDEQLERLMARIDAAGAGQGTSGGVGPGGFGPDGGVGPGGFGPDGGVGPGGFGPGAGVFSGRRAGAMRALRGLDLTDEQKEQIRAIHEARQDEIRTLVEQRGSMDADEFREQMDALREQIRAEVEGALTDEQLAELETFRQRAAERRAERRAATEARQEESRAAMADVLGLTDEQLAAIDALRPDREERRDEVRQLIDSGAGRADVRAYLEATRAAHREAVRQIVDDRQYAIMRIHSFLAGRFAARRAAGAKGEGGPGFGPGFGPGGGNGLNGPGVRPGGGPGAGRRG